MPTTLCFLSLVLLQAVPVEDIPHQPFIELLTQSETHSGKSLKNLKTGLEQERDDALRESKRVERHWEKELSSARRDLEDLNKISSFDSEGVATLRSDLHVEIAAREKGIGEKKKEYEETIPHSYDIQLTRVWLAEKWPREKSQIQDRIESGKARDRKHGDIEDIGYRLLVKNPDDDIEVGEQAVRQMTAAGWLSQELEDEEVQVYVRQLAARLAASSDLKVPLHTTVLDSPRLQAVALPGGFLYVTSGVLRAARTESELAGVLSREIARIAARHGTRTSRMAWLTRLFVPATQIVTGIFSGGTLNTGAYYGIGYGAESLQGILDRTFNGTDEHRQLEADQLGIQYAWKAGFDPSGFVSFVDNLASIDNETFLAARPPLRKRLLNIFSEIEYMPPQESPIIDTAEFRRIRERLIRL